jgi:hypothetical protein
MRRDSVNPDESAPRHAHPRHMPGIESKKGQVTGYQSAGHFAQQPAKLGT